jgi:predicted kinase
VKTVTWLVGPPGCGKSTWVKNHLQNAERETVVINSDAVVEKWAAENGLTYTEAFEHRDWDFVYRLPCEGYCALFYFKDIFDQLYCNFFSATHAGKDVIVDMTNTMQRFFLAHTPPDYHKRAVIFEIDGELLRKRLLNRERTTGKHVPDRVVHDIIKTYIPVKDYEVHEIIVSKQE